MKVPDRVGSISVEGNTDTPDRVILRHVGLRTGQVLDYAEVGAAQGRLRKLWLFDPADPPVVEVLPNDFDATVKDIRIRVRERPWNWAILAAEDAVVGLATLDRGLLWQAAYRVTVEVRGINP